MNNLKDIVSSINALALTNFDAAKHLLEIVNDAHGTNYGFLNRRIVFYENPRSINSRAHDLWASL